MSGDCIFCKIVAGDIPSRSVYEDKQVLAFMDIMPMVKGHTLVIPKAHYESLEDTPAEVLERVIRVVQRVAKAQTRGLGAEGVRIVQSNGAAAGQVVPHIHFHVVPRFGNDGVPRGWEQKRYDNDDEMDGYAAKIEAAL